MKDKIQKILLLIYKIYVVLVVYIATLITFNSFYKLISGANYNNDGILIGRELSIGRVVTALIAFAIYFYVFSYCYKPIYFVNIKTDYKYLFSIFIIFLFVISVITFKTLQVSLVALFTAVFLIIFNFKGLTFKENSKISFGYNTFMGSLALMSFAIILFIITAFVTQPLIPAPDGY